MAEDNLKHKAKIGMYWSFFNQFANNGLSFIVGVIMARILSPEDYGITALPAVFIAVASVFIDSGFSSALVRKTDLTEKDLSTSFYYSLIVGLTCYVLIFMASPWIADFYSTPILEPLIRVTALTFLWGPLNTPQNVILQRRLDFKTPAIISIITKIVGASIGIGFAYAGFGIWALVLMGTISSFLSFIQTWISVKWMPKEKWSKQSFKYLWNFGNKIIVTYLIDKIYQNIAPIVIGKYYSTADLGQYNRADAYAKLPSTLATGVLQSVTFPVLSKIQDNKEILAAKYRQMIKSSTFIVLPIMFGLAALAHPVVVLLIGEKWIPCVPYLRIISITMALYPLQSLNVNLLMVKGRSDLYLRLEIAKKVIGIIMLIITLPISIYVLVCGFFVQSIINLVLNTYYTGKLIGVTLFIQVKDILPSVLNGLLMFASVYAITVFFDNLLLQVFVGTITGICIYLSIAYLFKFREIEDVVYMLKFRSKL